MPGGWGSGEGAEQGGQSRAGTAGGKRRVGCLGRGGGWGFEGGDSRVGVRVWVLGETGWVWGGVGTR